MSTILIRLILFALSFINTIDTYRIRRDIDFVERIQPESYSSAIDDQCQLPSTVLIHLSHLSCDCVTDDDDDDDDGSFNICNKENSMKLRLCAQKVRTYVSNAVGGQWAAIIFSSSNVSTARTSSHRTDVGIANDDNDWRIHWNLVDHRQSTRSPCHITIEINESNRLNLLLFQTEQSNTQSMQRQKLDQFSRIAHDAVYSGERPNTCPLDVFYNQISQHNFTSYINPFEITNQWRHLLSQTYGDEWNVFVARLPIDEHDQSNIDFGLSIPSYQLISNVIDDRQINRRNAFCIVTTSNHYYINVAKVADQH